MANHLKVEQWKPPKWTHKINVSDTSFLEPRKLHHGNLLEKEQKEKEKHKNDNANCHRDVPKQSILAVIQIQEFEELFDELFELENSKLRLIDSTSKEIDNLRQRIIFLSGETIKNNPTQKTYLESFLSFFTFGSNDDDEQDKHQPITRAKFSNTAAMEERIKQIKRTKMELIQQTSKEIDELRQIIQCLEYINQKNKNGNKNINQSKWNMLYILLGTVCAVTVGVVL